ncbi:MAG: phosphoglycerate kinase [Anaerolineae bacterium]|nr:phosphoglycerate kinase [Anaerolineae bacterium]
MNKKTVRDINWNGKRAVVRVDFNVPLENGQVTDDTRIRESLPTIRYLMEHGAKTVLLSHLGRPKGKVAPEFSLKPAADHLAKLLGKPVTFIPELNDAAQQTVNQMQPGGVALAENTRFYAGEEKNDAALAQKFASLGDVFVNDAFGSAHRAHSSTEGIAHYLPAVAGFLMEKELDYLGRALGDPARPFIAILGGAKISDKIQVVRSLLAKTDYLLIGGGMANTFLKAKGLDMGASLVENDAVDTAKTLMDEAGGKLILPVDAVVADRFAADAERKIVSVSAVPEGWRILDIGPDTVKTYTGMLQDAKTVVWNGPMGVFEMAPFAEGTFAIARALATLPDATTIIGGGDSAAAAHESGVADKITHISTGGGASLEFLEGKTLPGVAALADE